MTDKTIVRFARPWPPYNVGETAGFAPATAEHLRQAGLIEAEPAEEEAGEPERPAAPAERTQTPPAGATRPAPAGQRRDR